MQRRDSDSYALKNLYHAAREALASCPGISETPFREIREYLRSLEAESVSEEEITHALEFAKAGILYSLYQIYLVDESKYADHKPSTKRATIYDDYTYYVNQAITYVNMTEELEWSTKTTDSRLAAAIAVGALYYGSYLNKRIYELDFDKDHKLVLLNLIKDIEPATDSQRYCMAFVCYQLHSIYRKECDIDKTLDYALRGLQYCMAITDVPSMVLNTISFSFAKLSEAFCFDTDMKILFEFGSKAFKHQDIETSLYVLAGIVWRYNNDFNSVSPARQRALMAVLDMIQNCIDAGKFSRDASGKRISFFPKNAFRREMDEYPERFATIYSDAHASHIDFTRIINQPQLPFTLYLQSEQRRSEITSLAVRMHRFEAQHATLFQGRRSREEGWVDPEVSQPLLKSPRQGE